MNLKGRQNYIVAMLGESEPAGIGGAARPSSVRRAPESSLKVKREVEKGDAARVPATLLESGDPVHLGDTTMTLVLAEGFLAAAEYHRRDRCAPAELRLEGPPGAKVPRRRA